MKLSNIIFLMSLCCLFLSCGGTENTPQAVATEYCKAMFNGEFEKAKSFCTPQTKGAVDFVVGFMNNEKLEKIKSAKKEFYIIDYTIDEKEGTATVKLKAKLKFKDEEKTEVEDQKVEMVKVDGKWKVSLKIK